jgi:hypothetical protein
VGSLETTPPGFETAEAYKWYMSHAPKDAQTSGPLKKRGACRVSPAMSMSRHGCPYSEWTSSTENQPASLQPGNKTLIKTAKEPRGLSLSETLHDTGAFLFLSA